ncbi:hypothetical protein Tco_0774706 [Tanacetum coccineum]|uniref:Retrovirus-related Pol polyprotein from transposon TNT 1-94-like beta-barrel domain-containing protein n=1 Tax=Tanacetum coccineum TaxID=301880 RepID=A0ABQ4ZP94_9ASTR
MIRGQPGLDELDFDDLYNNLKVYEHELKGVSNSNSQNIAFLSTEVKGSTLKQSTAEPAHIPKGYTQAISSKVPTAPNYLLQIDEDAMEEIDIRWQVAMITARIRKFMRKTGRSIDLKPKNGITFDKFNSKSLVGTDNNEDIDWTKEFDAELVTYAMMALTEVEQDDWSMEFDAEHMHFGQDGLDDFDWSNKADDAPVSLALMATNSEVMLKTHEKNEYAWGDKNEDHVSGFRADRYDNADVMMVMSAEKLLGWIMYSGGSYHMTYIRDYLVHFEEYDGGNVLLGDGRECRVQGTGNVRVHMRDGSSFVLNNVRYVPELRRNLISLGTLEKEGFTMKMQSGRVKILKDGSQEVHTMDLLYYHSTHGMEQHSTQELFRYREDSNEAAYALVEAEKIYAHESLTFNNTIACKVISKWKVGLKEEMDAQSDVYVLINGCRKSSDNINN